MPYTHRHRPMPPLLNPLRGAQRLRRGLLAVMAVAGVTLLGGCSIWPKALTWGSDPLPAQEQAVPAAVVPPSTTVAPVVATATPVSAPAAVEPKPEVTSPVVAAPAQVETPPPARVQPQVLPPLPQPAVAPPPPKTVPASGLVHGFYINVGLFAVPGNGRNAYQKLDAAGLPVFLDGIQSKKGPLTRVRVGPFTTRAQADAAAKKIRALQLAAIVFRH